MLIAPSHPALTPFIAGFWVSAARDASQQAREHVLPTGQMHLVFRLAGPPLQVFDSVHDTVGRVIDGPVIGGARASYYAKRLDAAVLSVGAQLKPGAAQALFGVSAADLADTHTPLADVWGSGAQNVWQQLMEARSQQACIAKFEHVLLARVRSAPVLHPAVARAIEMLRQPVAVQELVRGSGYSHRGLIALFKHATGLSPKRYASIMRFQTVLRGLRQTPAADLADLAQRAGYSDQAHMTRAFHAFAGVTPAQYRALAPPSAHHVVPARRSNLFNTLA